MSSAIRCACLPKAFLWEDERRLPEVRLALGRAMFLIPPFDFPFFI